MSVIGSFPFGPFDRFTKFKSIKGIIGIPRAFPDYVDGWGPPFSAEAAGTPGTEPSRHVVAFDPNTGVPGGIRRGVGNYRFGCNSTIREIEGVKYEVSWFFTQGGDFANEDILFRSTLPHPDQIEGQPILWYWENQFVDFSYAIFNDYPIAFGLLNDKTWLEVSPISYLKGILINTNLVLGVDFDFSIRITKLSWITKSAGELILNTVVLGTAAPPHSPNRGDEVDDYYFRVRLDAKTLQPAEDLTTLTGFNLRQSAGLPVSNFGMASFCVSDDGTKLAGLMRNGKLYEWTIDVAGNIESVIFVKSNSSTQSDQQLDLFYVLVIGSFEQIKAINYKGNQLSIFTISGTFTNLLFSPVDQNEVPPPSLIIVQELVTTYFLKVDNTIIESFPSYFVEYSGNSIQEGSLFRIDLGYEFPIIKYADVKNDYYLYTVVNTEGYMHWQVEEAYPMYFSFRFNGDELYHLDSFFGTYIGGDGTNYYGSVISDYLDIGGITIYYDQDTSKLFYSIIMVIVDYADLYNPSIDYYSRFSFEVLNSEATQEYLNALNVTEENAFVFPLGRYR